MSHRWQFGFFLVCSGALCLPLAAAEPAAAPPDATAAVDPTLARFSDATAQLYNRISGSLVRIRLDQSPAAFLSAPMVREFQDWRRSQATSDEGRGAGRGGGGPGPGGGNRRGGGSGRGGMGGGRRGFGGNLDNGSGTGDDTTVVRPGNAALVRRFVEQKISTLADSDPDQAAALRGLLFRLDAVRAGITGDLFGVVIDDKGTAIILTGMLREAQQDSLRVTAPDGSETTAKFIGAYPSRGYSIIQLDKPALTRPVAFAEGRPAPGSLLLSIAASNGAVGWVVTPGRLGTRPADERIALFAQDDRGGAFVFDTEGRLAALAFGRFGLPMDDLKHDITWIVENHQDVTPRQLGVRYSLVPAGGGAPRSRDAARVDAVMPGSIAARAGLVKGDIVLSIDRRPINQLPQIQMDLATRSGTVPLGIERDGKPLTLQLPLDNK